ncbi:MAG TPA: TonB-dependent receptor, partial [Chitinophagaceae bacterium]|nr:TonB-dependent receptor [Chitinophagaceae bacterium]
ANGAIVITTKKGKKGQGLGISYNGSYQVEHIYKNGIGLQNEYGSGTMYQREGHFRPDGTQTFTSISFGPKFDGSMHPAIHDPSLMVPYVAQPDNWKVFFQDGLYANHNISLSGGSDKSTFRFSYSNLDNKGTLVNNKIDRNSLDLRYTSQINKVFSFDGGASYALTHSLNAYGQGRYYWPSGQNVGFMTYYAVPRNTDLAAWRNDYRNPDGSMKDYGYSLYNSQVNATFNRFDNYFGNRYEKSLLVNAQLKAQVTDWIDLSARANLNDYRIFYENKERGGGAFGSGGSYGVGGNYTFNYDYLFMAHANRTFANSNLETDLRFISEIYGNGKSESYGASTDGGLIVPNVFTLSNSVNDIRNNRSYSFTRPNNKVVGAGAILNLSWKDYLNLELTSRQDWISSLTYPDGVPGANNYTVFYPSANASWAFSDMWRDKMPDWLSFGNLRASIAWVGNGTDPFATSFGSYNQGTVVNMNGQSVIIANRDNADVLPNLDLKPEKQRSIELGTNLSFLNDRIGIDVAVYKTNTFNQILTIPGVLETGYKSRRINAGDIQNKGIEISLNLTPVKRKDLVWNANINFTSNRGKINKFYPGITEYALMGDYDLAGVYAYEGGDFGVLTANPGYYAWRAYDPTSGLPIIRYGGEQNSNGSKFPLYYWQEEQYNYQNPDPNQPWQKADHRHNIGRVEPRFLAGFNSSVRWKDFTLFAQIDARVGGWVYSESYNYGMGRGNVSESLQFRDKEHGGQARTDSYTNETVYN